MRRQAETRSTSRQLVVLALITVGAAALRFTRLGSESFWIDEVSEAQTASLIGSQGWRAVASRDNASPLSHYVLWFMQRLFGNSEFVARLPAAIAGIVLVPVTYALAKRLFSTRIALISALLVAIAPYGLWYSRDARMYSLFTLASTLYLLCFVRLIREPSRRNTIVLVVLGVIGLYVHEYFVFVLISTCGYMAIKYFRSSRQLVYRLVVANAVSFACFVPWLAALSSYEQGSAGSQRGGLLFFAPYTLVSYFIGFNLGPSVREMQTFGAATAMRQNSGAIAVPIVVVVVIFGALIATLYRHAKSKESDDAIYFIAAVTAVMIAGPILIDAVSSRINFNVRYCADALVPTMILTAVAVEELCRRRRLANILWAVLAVVMALASFRVLWPGNRYAREDIRSVSRYLSAAAPSAGSVFVESDTVVAGLRWYGYDGPLEGIHTTSDAAITAKIDAPHVLGDTVILVESREWETDPDHDVVKRLIAGGYTLDTSRGFAGASVSRFTFVGHAATP